MDFFRHYKQRRGPYVASYDVTMRLSGTMRTASNVSETFFHEFAHAQHYFEVGPGYWVPYIGYIVANKGYGSKTSSGVGRVAVGEAWGFFIGATFNEQKYRSLSSPAIAERHRRFLENQRRDDNVPIVFDGTNSRGWIPWGLLHDMTDVGEPTTTGINDRVSGYSATTVFRDSTPILILLRFRI